MRRSARNRPCGWFDAAVPAGLPLLGQWRKAGAEGRDAKRIAPPAFSAAYLGGQEKSVYRIGLISDTHGLLRPEALAYLCGSDHILHAGDIGSPEILTALACLAPLTAVRGNNDQGAWTDTLPVVAELRVGEVLIRIIHEVAKLSQSQASSAQVVVYGHAHKPTAQLRDGVWWINPGSAGPRRFKLPVAVGELLVDGTTLEGSVMTLEVNPEIARRLR